MLIYNSYNVSIILCEGLELLLLGGQDLQHPFVDGLVGKQTVHQYIPGLSHTVGTGDCLVFNGRCQLGFTEYHHTGCLDIQACTTGLHLADQHYTSFGNVEFVHDLLPNGRTDITGNDLAATVAQQRADLFQRIAEERKHNDLSTLLFGENCSSGQPIPFGCLP